MFLSCLLIDTGNDPDRPRPGRLWLRNHYRVHQRLSMAFPSRAKTAADPLHLQPYEPSHFLYSKNPQAEGASSPARRRTHEQDFLFRLDPHSGGSPSILVQSAIRPDWDYAFQNTNFLSAPLQIKEFSTCFQVGASFRFRLLANPVKKIGTLLKQERLALKAEGAPIPGDRKGQRVSVPAGELDLWLLSRAPTLGFRVERLDSVQPGYVLANGGDDKGARFRSARYDGVLVVEDAARFETAVIGGIGPAKAFGFGLLSLAPVPGNPVP